MAEILRLHSTGANNILDWGNSNQYNAAIINNIADPAGANATKEITSIPSPFARMDLVKKAFDFVNNNGLDGTTIHHKMVSHALDVAQMFFDFDKYKDQGLLDLIKWDIQEINNLCNSNDAKHKLLGQTLNLFLKADANQFNFDDMNGLYMLRYKGPGAPASLTIVGSTSPASLFYTSANNYSFLDGQIVFGGHQVLSDDANTFLSLKNRSNQEFIYWFYALKNAIPNFANLFPEVDRYLQLNYAQLSYNLQQRINGINNQTLLTDYLPLVVSAGVPVEILGTQISKNRPVNWGETSDFAIASPRAGGQPPLVLPSDVFAYPWKYTTAQWNPNIQVPLQPGNINSRVLPSDGSRYPYLTMTDFLEDTLIMTESRPNPQDFFDGNLTNNTQGENSFLLPIKRKYFEYFTSDDLRQNIKITCENAPGGGYAVKVSLKIPTRKGDITFERLYISNSETINPKNGRIVTKDFTLLLFPKTKFINATPDYVVGVMSKEQGWSPRVECITNSNDILVPVLGPFDRNMDAAGNRVNAAVPIMPMSSFNQNFDVIELSSGKLRGITIPIWSGVAGGTIFEFAVDFGTSNTHIEYKTAAQNQSRPLDIGNTCRQLSTFNEDALSDPSYDIAIKNNCIPNTMGDTNEIHFPMRTLLSYKRATNWNTPTAPYITGNMPFYYGIIAPADYNAIKSDLKWSNDPNIAAMVKCYLGSLIHVMRNKVVMEGGDLPNTKIRWFYPTSMPAATVTMISNIWTGLYQTHIGPNVANLEAIPESVAPYEYYQNNFGAGVDVLTVDIGGGTSDAYIVDTNGTPACITSFRFAANSLLGDGFVAAGLANNGFVSKYRPIINETLNANNLGNIVAILEDVAATGISADYISLLFGLKDNTDVKNGKCQDNVDFLKLLQSSPGAKTLVLLFYTAIIYHLATFIKAKKGQGLNIQEPAVLAFSGNGSKLLQVLGVNTPVGKGVLEDFTKAIFEKVNHRPYPHQLFKIVIEPNKPKEATCKGGLLMGTVPTLPQIQAMKDTLLGTSDSRFVGQSTYDQLSDVDWDGLQEAIKDFTKVFFDLVKEKDTENNLGTVSLADLQTYREYFASDIKTRTSNALTFMHTLNEPRPIEDTLFFYPITELLNVLANKLL